MYRSHHRQIVIVRAAEEGHHRTSAVIAPIECTNIPAKLGIGDKILIIRHMEIRIGAVCTGGWAEFGQHHRRGHHHLREIHDLSIVIIYIHADIIQLQLVKIPHRIGIIPAAGKRNRYARQNLSRSTDQLAEKLGHRLNGRPPREPTVLLTVDITFWLTVSSHTE